MSQSENHLVSLLDQSIDACRALAGATGRLDAGLHLLRDRIRAGEALSALGGGETRHTWEEFYSALAVLQQHLSDARAESYRSAVDDHRLSLTEVARRSDCSRQRVGAIVRQGRAARTGPDGPAS